MKLISVLNKRFVHMRGGSAVKCGMKMIMYI